MPCVTLGRRVNRAAPVSMTPHAGDRRVGSRVIGAVPNTPPRQLDAVENLISSIWSRRWPRPIWFVSSSKPHGSVEERSALESRLMATEYLALCRASGAHALHFHPAQIVGQPGNCDPCDRSIYRTSHFGGNARRR